VIQANLLSSVAQDNAKNQVYNVAVGDRTTLNDLVRNLVSSLKERGIDYPKKVIHREFREGDVRHSQANVDKAGKLLGYQPKFKIADGLNVAMDWYVKDLTR
jgi:UDP-N-acetylglucosamine 4-epimerase